ncbi:MAG TPA: D-glycero-beta-D-manno-heptose 1-phosphate adenylyltransferase [Caulobacteraceae bacterium]|nr:D-glycero-beta-D-manno-heptose 1-phosphate adenylyltransferase [Caulobacteraceae bacterium]
MDLTSLQTLLARLPQARVLCVGDVMVDRFVDGEVDRISPEAPIPVLSRSHQETMLGGAGNVARNIASLGGLAALVGLVGDDAAGHEALGLLEGEAGLESHLVSRAGRRTTLKTRFTAAGQQLLRVDHEDRHAPDEQAQASLAQAVRSAGDEVHAILISDYAKGVVTDAVIAACHAAATARGIPIVVDPKGRDFRRYGAVDLIKPNASELAAATGLPVGTDAEAEAALSAALEASSARAIAVTRGGRGLSFRRRDGETVHVRARPREVFDVSGAGDTALAALGLALATGSELEAAGAFAVLASGVAVGKPGTAVVTPDELIDAELTQHAAPAHARIATPERMAAEVAKWKGRGLRVGFTNGCFDILHRGHVAYLAQARSWCDRLIVGLNSDASVRALKGEGRPVNDLEGRALVLGSLEGVDLVVPFDAPTPEALIRAARPDVLIKGSDYAVEQVVGGDFVRSYGGEVRLADFVDGHSTSEAIARMKRA